MINNKEAVPLMDSFFVIMFRSMSPDRLSLVIHNF